MTYYIFTTDSCTRYMVKCENKNQVTEFKEKTHNLGEENEFFLDMIVEGEITQLHPHYRFIHYKDYFKVAQGE